MAVLLVATCTSTAGAAVPAPLGLKFATNPSAVGVQGMLLSRQPITGTIYIYVSNTSLTSATFYVDDPNGLGRPAITVSRAPFGFQLTSSRLCNGPHNVLGIVTAPGKSLDVFARFTTSGSTTNCPPIPRTTQMPATLPAQLPIPTASAPELPTPELPTPLPSFTPQTGGTGDSGDPPAAAPVPTGGSQKELKIWITGYSYQDNTPPGSPDIGTPVIHKQADGQGTYEDPITAAVPGKGGGIWKAGARFYLPTLKRYIIVEDTGASPAPSGQDGHLDVWIGGQGGTKSDTDACMDQITGENKPAIMNPPPGLPVIKGPIWNGGCKI